MGCYLSAEEEEKRARSNQIDKQIEKDGGKLRKEWEDLFLDGSDIGKAAKYILLLFTQTNQTRLNIDPHLTQATDTSNDYQGEEAILLGAYWLSNVHELLSFASLVERDMLHGVNPAVESSGRVFEWHDYERLVSIVKHDLESLEYNIYHTWMKELKKRLFKMVIPAVIESQSLPGFITSESRFLTKYITGPSTPAFSMDDLLNFLNKVWKAMKSYYVEMSVIQQVVTELLKLIGVTSFNDLLMRRNFCSWKRALQIQYNITRIEEWCKSHDMPEGTLQLEHLMQATKLLLLKKATLGDIEIIYDVCWILTPTQIQKLISHYFLANYENPISPEILKAVASRVVANDKTDILLLDTTSLEDSKPFDNYLPRRS